MWALWETAVCAVFHGLLDPDAQDLAAAIGQHGQREIHGFDAPSPRRESSRAGHRKKMAEWVNFMSMLNGRGRGSPHDLFGVKRFPGHGYSL